MRQQWVVIGDLITTRHLIGRHGRVSAGQSGPGYSCWWLTRNYHPGPGLMRWSQQCHGPRVTNISTLRGGDEASADDWVTSDSYSLLILLTCLMHRPGGGRVFSFLLCLETINPELQIMPGSRCLHNELSQDKETKNILSQFVEYYEMMELSGKLIIIYSLFWIFGGITALTPAHISPSCLWLWLLKPVMKLADEKFARILT